MKTIDTRKFGQALIDEMDDAAVRGYAVDQYVEMKRIRSMLDRERTTRRERFATVSLHAWCVGVASAFSLGLVIGLAIGALT